MDGGAPAGASNLPAEVGCRTKRIRMSIRMKTGKMRTIPKGTETVELPRNRSGLLSRAKREDMALLLDVSLLSSSDVGSSIDFDDGAILDARLNRSMVVM